MSEKQLTFIASGGRTGTKFFGDILSDVISDCYSEHEPDLFAGASRLTLQRLQHFGLWHMVIGRLFGKTGIRVIGQKYLKGEITIETAKTRLKAMRAGYHKSIHQPLVIESYYSWWMVAAHIGTIWPEARVAGILRDPRDWIASWLRHYSRRRNGALTELLPPGPLTPESVGDSAAAHIWPSLDQIGRLAWEWSLIVRTLEHAAVASKDVELFRFEDIFDGDGTDLARFVSFVSSHSHGPAHKISNLSTVTEDVRNASTGSKSGWQTWTDTQIAAVSHFCGRSMVAYGYGLEPEWQARVQEASAFYTMKS